MRLTALAGCLALAACSTGPYVTSGDSSALGTAPPAPEGAAPLDWGTCDDEDVDPDGGFECATLAVPWDHDDLAAGTFDMAVIRLPADPEERRGAIVFNPGGPGASGVEFVALGGAAFELFLGSDVTRSFDIVGFDPRGTGSSAPIRCVDDAWLDAHAYADPTPDDPDEERIAAEAETGFTEACIEAYGERLAAFSTVATARDMDHLRAALGDDLLHYYGISYGTYLGAAYATLFPERVGAMVLDAAFDPSGEDSAEVLRTQLVGFEEAFSDWSAWCDDEARCAFGGSGPTAERWDRLREELDSTPVAAADGREAGSEELELATIQAMYARALWPRLALASAEAERGDGTRLLELVDEYQGREEDGTFDPMQQANTVISCASGIADLPPADPDVAAADLLAAAPRFAIGITAESLAADSCAELVGSAVVPLPLVYTGDGPVVVVGGLNDPATPFRWAEKLANVLGASLVTFDGDGHGALGSSTCVHELAAELFLEGAAPPTGTVCGADEPVARPEWFDTIPTVDGVTSVELLGMEEALGLAPTLLYSEMASTALPMDEAAGRLDEALRSAGFDAGAGGELPDIGGATRQSIYFAPDGALLIVIVLDPDAVADLFGDQAELLADLVPSGQTVILLSHPGE